MGDIHIHIIYILVYGLIVYIHVYLCAHTRRMTVIYIFMYIVKICRIIWLTRIYYITMTVIHINVFVSYTNLYTVLYCIYLRNANNSNLEQYICTWGIAVCRS